MSASAPLQILKHHQYSLHEVHCTCDDVACAYLIGMHINIDRFIFGSILQDRQTKVQVWPISMRNYVVKCNIGEL